MLYAACARPSHHNNVSNLLCTFRITFPSLCSSNTLRSRTSSDNLLLQPALSGPY